MARKDIIMLSQQELKRLHVIQKVLDGVLKQVEVAEILSLSVDLTPDPKNTHRIDDLPFGNGFATPLIGTFLHSRTAWKDLTPQTVNDASPLTLSKKFLHSRQRSQILWSHP